MASDDTTDDFEEEVTDEMLSDGMGEYLVHWRPGEALTFSELRAVYIAMRQAALRFDGPPHSSASHIRLVVCNGS